ncbi:Vacuolar membrane protease [Elsinoe australis]|uniref:Peptide hydrolase n=1 Tax=Elsinoe australis TaxID=40998 RepID=A0A2P8AI80_9PEZI|nr:Vacuolar membrane protease [Elsinoe australis]
MARSWNPFAFTPLPVSIFGTAIYVAIFAGLLVVHHQVPSPPSNGIPKHWAGVYLTQAWLDLKILSNSYHPYNSQANLDVRAWLAERVAETLDKNNMTWHHEGSEAKVHARADDPDNRGPDAVALLDDRVSNITFPDSRSYVNYFEGDNLLVYIRGTRDPPGHFWLNESTPTVSLTLVNAHYDSVSTGFGATDDGGGVVSILQLLSHFTTKLHMPEHGIVLMLNNGEEDGLYGAYAYYKHPISKHTRVFLNLEGAGAGGRATLFRSTDAAITAPYAKSKYLFGTVVSSDGFKRGLVRSGTDYSVFNEALGMRGLDVAYMGPRARYHTGQDDARDSSRGSVWHMLSAALATTTELARKDWDRDDGESGVWFDVFGRAFAVLRLHTLFALCVALLVVGPISLIVVEVVLKKKGKWYPFSFKTYLHGQDDDEPVKLYGLRGFFRFPITFVISSAAVVALAYLVAKINPYIIYSSPYVVWAMMMAAHISISWFLLCLIGTLRPTALSRLYTLLWLYVLSWLLLLLTAIVSARFDISGLYFTLIYNLTILLSLHISYLDLFALPTKSQYVIHVSLGATASRRASHDPQPTSRPTSSRAPGGPNETDDANERTALLSPTSTRPRDRQTFARYNQRRPSHDPSITSDTAASIPDLATTPPYENEQAWSGPLPTWTWIPQLLLLLPLNLILVGQISLLLTTALHQTPADGNDVLSIYLFIAGLTVLLLVPSWPVLGRVVWQLPTVLFFVAVGTGVFALLGEPFTRDARLKVFFVQRVDLETGRNTVAVNGVKGWVERVVGEMPSAGLGAGMRCLDFGERGEEEVLGAGKDGLEWAARRGLRTCAWEGLGPDVLRGYTQHNGVKGTKWETRNKTEMRDWIRFAASKVNGTNVKRERFLLELQGLNTRSCRLYFEPAGNQTVQDVTVLNACPGVDTATFGPKNATSCPQGRQVTPDSTPVSFKTNNQIRLWSRTFDPSFKVVVDVDRQGRGLKGKAMCVWSDSNEKGTVPALDELRAYAPVWSTATKNGDGLVEGWKGFEL